MTKKKAAKRPVAVLIRLSDDARAAVDRIAAQNETSRAAVVRMAVTAYLAAQSVRP